jgi:hypothetical protein
MHKSFFCLILCATTQITPAGHSLQTTGPWLTKKIKPIFLAHQPVPIEDWQHAFGGSHWACYQNFESAGCSYESLGEPLGI